MPCADPALTHEIWRHVKALVRAMAMAPGDGRHTERTESIMKDLQAGRALLQIVPADKVAAGPAAVVKLRASQLDLHQSK